MPGPLSRTATLNAPSAADASIATSPLSVNLMALPTRLSSTWARRRSSPRPAGRPWAILVRQREILLRRQRLDRDIDALHQLGERIVRQRQRELAGFDLRQIEHVVDQSEQMLAVGLHALEHCAHLFRRLAVDVVEDQLGVAENGVERRAQLVAHIGQELRLVPARHFELPALVLDLVEQPRVLDRQHRLRGEGLHQLDGILRERAGRAAADHQHADDIVAADAAARPDRARKPARSMISLTLGGGFRAQVGDLDRLAPAQAPPQRSDRSCRYADRVSASISSWSMP